MSTLYKQCIKAVKHSARWQQNDTIYNITFNDDSVLKATKKPMQLVVIVLKKLIYLSRENYRNCIYKKVMAGTGVLKSVQFCLSLYLQMN